MLLLLAGAFQAEQPASLHTPLDRATTAARIFVDCLVQHAGPAATGRAAPRIAVAIARRQCTTEERALDDVYRSWQAAERRPRRGAGHAELERLQNEAIMRIEDQRRAR